MHVLFITEHKLARSLIYIFIFYFFIDTVFILPISCKLPRGCLFSTLDSYKESYDVFIGLMCILFWFGVPVGQKYKVAISM